MDALTSSVRPLTDDTGEQLLSRLRQQIRPCIQCGTCTGSCPNAFAMDQTPRRLWRMVLMGQTEEIWSSRTFVLCSACYYCTLRCPRGLPLTDAMETLKQIAARRKKGPYVPSARFYGAFMNNIRRNGRIRETQLMTGYFAAMKNPWMPMRYASLAMKLARKGKMGAPWPGRRRSVLEPIFRKAEEEEGAR